MHDNHIVPLGKSDSLFKEGKRRDRRYRIIGIVQNHEASAFGHLFRYGIQIGQKSVFCPQRHGVWLRTCQMNAAGINRVAGIGHQHDVSGIGPGKGKMSQTVL